MIPFLLFRNERNVKNKTGLIKDQPRRSML